jgi:hypothetical protein
MLLRLGIKAQQLGGVAGGSRSSANRIPAKHGVQLGRFQQPAFRQRPMDASEPSITSDAVTLLAALSSA